MKMYWSALILALATVGCSSINKDTAYHGEPGTAFLLVVEDNPKADEHYSFVYEFRGTNAAKIAFAKQSKLAYFSGLHDVPSGEFAKPRTSNIPLRLAGMRVPPGDYALLSHVTSGYTEQGDTTFFTCYSLGAAVFRIQEGVINLVHTSASRDGPTLDADTTRAYVGTVLADYPNLTAPVLFAAPVGSITFRSAKNILGNETCTPDGPLTFTPRSGP